MAARPVPDVSAGLQITRVTDYCVTTCLLCLPPALSHISVVTVASSSCHHLSPSVTHATLDLAIRQTSLNWYCPSSLITIFIVSFNTTQRLQFPLIRSVVDSLACGVSDPRSDIFSERDCLASACPGDPAPQACSSSTPKVLSRFVPSWLRNHLLQVPAAHDGMLLW